MRFLLYTILCAVTALNVSCSSFNRSADLDDDNWVEEIIEEMLKNKTGFEMDFTPGTEERK